MMIYGGKAERIGIESFSSFDYSEVFMIKDWAQSILEAAVILLLLYIFLWPVSVVGVSMYPTLNDKDRVVISRFSAINGTYNRGDLIVFDADNYKEDMVKRVIAFGGESLEIKDGKIYIDGQELDEDYILGYTDGQVSMEIPEDMVFVMGDNRTESFDSRDFGPVDSEDIYGKVIFRFFPLNKVTLFD